MTDLETKLKYVNKELAEAKSERNQLMIETFNLRRDNKQLETQLCSKNGKDFLKSGVRLPDGRRLYTASCVIRTK